MEGVAAKVFVELAELEELRCVADVLLCVVAADASAGSTSTWHTVLDHLPLLHALNDGNLSALFGGLSVGRHGERRQRCRSFRRLESWRAEGFRAVGKKQGRKAQLPAARAKLAPTSRAAASETPAPEASRQEPDALAFHVEEVACEDWH